MSSMSWAWVPTRRASAETAASSARAAFRAARSDCTAATPPAASARTRSTAAPPSTILQSSDQPCLRPGVLGRASFLGDGGLPGGLEELALGVGEGGLGAGSPVQRAGQPHAAVELTGRTPEAVPRVGRAAEVVADALAFDVVVEPASQSWPGAGQGLVGDLQDAVVAGDQAGSDKGLDQLVVGGRDEPSRHAAPDCFAFGAGRDQPEDQVAQLSALVRLDPRVEPLGGLGDGAVDPAGGAVAVDGEGVALAPLPRLEQGVRETGEGRRGRPAPP